ncbi:hypothetical protein M3J07_002823 [Ascochyta lentis]
MSQSYKMNPSINFTYVDEADCGNQATQFQNVYYPQWIYPGARTTINSVPSPTDTIHTTQTAPPRRTATRMSFQQSNRSVPCDNIDPSLQNPRYLALPGAHSFPTTQHHMEPIADPITRFWASDEPWNPMKYSNANAGQNNFNQPQRNFDQYPQRPCSDVGSNTPVSDSGYQTQPPQSIFSNDAGHVDQSLPAELMVQTKTLNAQTAPMVSHEMRRTSSDQRSVSNLSYRSGSQKQQIPCSVPDCFTISNCQSVHKKHMLKHEKAFVCTEQGCKRDGKGFATVNDLDRHKKSVHKIDSHKTKSYRCAHDECRNKTKIWPRLDNFKQHIARMHKEHDEFELIKKSECLHQEFPSALHSMSVDSALLAGLVGETAVSNGGLDSAASASPQSFIYPPIMSFSGQSTSGTVQESPSTDPFNVSFSRSGGLPSNRADGEPLTSQNGAESAESVHVRQTDTGNSTRTSPPEAAEYSVSPQGATSNRKLGLESKLSGAAQTKSEQQQQRQALEKLSKAKLEEMLLRIIGSQQQDGDSTSPGSESCKVSQEIANLTHQRIRPTRSQSRRSTQGSTSGMKACPYDGCRFVGRICDLNKHTKRHERSYGCTYPKCYKRFGAKSDWKRHENSQHFQQETFRCDFKSSSDEQCAQHYYRSAQFQKHLVLQHQVTSKDVLKNDLERCKIGKNCQVQFWCGFCCKIIPLVAKSNAAWDERFDHIAHHFHKDTPRKCVDDWICAEENRTKKQLLEGMLDERDEDLDARGLEDDESPTAAEGTAPPFSDPALNGSRKRSPSPATIDPRAATRRKEAVTRVVYCCMCGFNGATDLQGSCMDCYHIFCHSCKGGCVKHTSFES